MCGALFPFLAFTTHFTKARPRFICMCISTCCNRTHKRTLMLQTPKCSTDVQAWRVVADGRSWSDGEQRRCNCETCRSRHPTGACMSISWISRTLSETTVCCTHDGRRLGGCWERCGNMIAANNMQQNLQRTICTVISYYESLFPYYKCRGQTSSHHDVVSSALRIHISESRGLV